MAEPAKSKGIKPVPAIQVAIDLQDDLFIRIDLLRLGRSQQIS
jgi:hypothetical protein